MTERETFRFPDGTSYAITVDVPDPLVHESRFEVFLPPRRANIPPHIHPNQEEKYVILSGTLDVFLINRWIQVKEGETFTVPRGVVHTFRNGTDQPVRLLDIHQPARDFETYVERISKIALKREPGRRGKVANVLRIAGLNHALRHTVLSPTRRSRITSRVLAAVGRLTGYTG